MTLRKIYLVSPKTFEDAIPALRVEKLPKTRSFEARNNTRSVTEANAFNRWVTFRDRMREDDYRRNMVLQKLGTTLKKIWPYPASQIAFLKQIVAKTVESKEAQTEPVIKKEDETAPAGTPHAKYFDIGPTKSYETPKREDYDDDDNDDKTLIDPATSEC